MGRGRAKAKQTKVARELKYFSPDTDLNALERELGASKSSHEVEKKTPPEDDQGDDEYGDYEKWASGDR